MTAQAEYRKATLRDDSGIVEVFVKTRTECLAFLEWEYDHETVLQVFREYWFPKMEMWVATARGEVVGFVGFVPGELEHLYILPEHHGLGIGSALLDIALKSSPEECRLWVFQANLQARKFYERRGFVLEFETDGGDNMEKKPDARYLRR